ncbi:MAG: hypothetical protein KL785_02470 [Brevundimonas sp.]|nr:hypothetical protein [Brevundimonas sp.]
MIVGGLGLGYTARAALASPRVDSVEVVDALGPVIEWHRAGLVPIGDSLGREPRCTLSHGDFFGWFDEARAAGERYDVVLLDIDHSPRQLLHPDHGRFYTAEGADAGAGGSDGGGRLRHVVGRGAGRRLSGGAGIGVPRRAGGGGGVSTIR